MDGWILTYKCQPAWDCEWRQRLSGILYVYCEAYIHNRTPFFTRQPASQCTFPPLLCRSLYFHRYCSIKACWNERHLEYIKRYCMCANVYIWRCMSHSQNIYYMALTLTCKIIEYDSFKKKKEILLYMSCVYINEIIWCCKNIHICSSLGASLSLWYNKYAHQLFGKQIGLHVQIDTYINDYMLSVILSATMSKWVNYYEFPAWIQHELRKSRMYVYTFLDYFFLVSSLLFLFSSHRMWF